MANVEHDHLRRSGARLAVNPERLTATLAAAIGLLAFAGWVFDLPLLRSVLPGAVEMKANSAMGLVAAGLALFLLGASRPLPPVPLRTAQGLALAVAALGLATFAEYVFGWQLGIDEALFRDTTDAYNPFRGRMSPYTAVAFVGIGLALAARPYPAMRPLLWPVAGSVALIGSVSVIGYLWKVDELVTDRWLPPVAVHTAVALVLLAFGTLIRLPAPGATSDDGRALTRIEHKVRAGMLASVLLLLLGGTLTYRATAKIEEATRWVTHTQQVRVSLSRLHSMIADAESAKFAYLINGRPGLREDLQRFSAQAKRELLSLSQLVADNPAQTGNAGELKQLIEHQLDLFAELIARHGNQGFAAARKQYESSADAPSTNEIRVLTLKMDEHEERLLLMRQQALAGSRQITLIALLSTLLLAVAVFQVQFRGLRRGIEARRQAEAALQNSNTRVRTILDTVADGIITIDAQGIVETVNPASERIFGYAAAEIVGSNVRMLMPEPFQSQHDGYLEAFRSTGRSKILGVDRELLGRCKNGRTFPIELTVCEMQLGGERHFTGIVRDISKRKQAEDQFNRFFALSLDMLCVANADGYFTRLSPAFTKTLGWSTEELLARPFIDFVHPDDRDATRREVARQVEAGENVLQFENRYRHQDGSWRVLSWKSVPHEGGLMFAIARDITSRKAAEQALLAARDEAQRANAAKGVFLATMSHEIRTPLNGLLGMLELLALSRLDGEQRETLEAARDSGFGMLRIIDDVLDHAKIEAGKLEILPEAVSIPQLLRRVVNNYHASASAKGLTLSAVDDPRLRPALLADPLRLLQILGNFVSNAIKFTSTGGVEIRAELIERSDDADRVRLAVTDSGIGIDAAAQQRLFQPFEQAAADTSRMYGGTGLGLAISRRLTEMMGGSIAVDSAPGRGTTFSVSFRFPVCAAPATEPAGERALRDPTAFTLALAGGEAPQVLAVDDNPTNRRLLALQLGVLGLRAQTSAGAREALTMWQNGDFGIVITDCNMPEMDGYALSRAIRASEATQGRPRTLIVAWTANVLGDAAAQCRAAGMDEILTKPADLNELKQLLATALGGLRPAAASPETAPTASAATGPVDAGVFAGLSAVFAEDPAQLREFLDEFGASMSGIHAALRAAQTAGDAAAAESAAHKLKSSARALGALVLGELCARIEQAGHAGETQTLSELLPRLEAEVAAVHAWLDSFTAAPTP